MHYALNTFLQLEDGPFACRYVAGAAICSDGKVRSLRFTSGYPDTFFSIPCSVQVRGKTVTGFVTVETLDGLSTETEDDPACVKFCANQYGRNADVLPRGAWTKPKRELAWRDGPRGRAVLSNATKERMRMMEEDFTAYSFTRLEGALAEEQRNDPDLKGKRAEAIRQELGRREILAMMKRGLDDATEWNLGRKER